MKAMCEGPSMISGPIPPDPTLFPEYYRRPASARGRLEGNAEANAALLLGPLAPDPSLYPGCYSARAPPPRRIGANATHILERDRKGMVGSLLALEGVALHPSPPRLKQQVRDYGKENVRRLREIQKRCREQEAERERSRPVPVKALWTSPKYQDVPSKVMTHLQETSPPKKPECQNFLKGHSRCGSAGLPRPRSSPSPNTGYSPHSEICVQGRAVDFVSFNARSAGKASLRRSQSLQNLAPKQAPPTPSQKGRVPQYLEERKQQWRREEEERRKNTPDPSIPPGHTQMSEQERLETLESLKNTQQSLVKELLSLPVRVDTLSVRTRRAQLDRKLSEVEEAIKIFSRDKVYVKIDS
ncbi:enkurin domain-containing protein 1 isoform X1 [Anguilla anguilla]|uniref:enkurin domain-containing protein 1 isoform X1 n=2 Tax=Anguilla anguilla TaxID=7936 RepID=UPI0015ABE69E|nr:enkurin domain-containing protein 1 isoform X1 [Anguilla anguilla]